MDVTLGASSNEMDKMLLKGRNQASALMDTSHDQLDPDEIPITSRKRHDSRPPTAGTSVAGHRTLKKAPSNTSDHLKERPSAQTLLA